MIIVVTEDNAEHLAADEAFGRCVRPGCPNNAAERPTTHEG